MNKAVVFVVLLIVVIAAAYYWFFIRQSPGGGGENTFKGINGVCACDPKTLLSSGATGGMLMDNASIGSQYTMMFSFFNNCEKTLYLVGTYGDGSRTKFIDVSLGPKKLLRQGLSIPNLVAGVMWVTDNSSLLDDLRQFPRQEPDPTMCLRLEMTITQDAQGNWNNGGNVSYVDATSIPVLMYFGPGKIMDVDDNPDGNNKLIYSTCTQDQLMKDCPTMVSQYNTCISPGHFCNVQNKGQPNWSQMCDDSTGDMSTYIKAFGLDKVDPNLTADQSGQWPLSRFIYNNGNNFKSTNTPYELGSFYWPTPDKKGSSYSFTTDEQSRMFVGQVDSQGNIAGAPASTQPAPKGQRITAYNSVMNGWAMARGMCDPNDVLNNCGGQGGDYMAMYTQQPSTDKNNFTKGDNNMANNVSAWHTGKFPDNRYARYVTEHTHLIYGFPYDEGVHGGYSSVMVPTGTKPQMCVIFCPTCTKIDDMIRSSASAY